ncbi:hypothetical protein ACGFY9_14010 [Streptomyces sp. NPDC048504]|uniref:hypothetical protein n=1 Tax=Streptomyces sp. NPDC048504 TaxID=3365559 RepID=UPI0037136951
MMRDPDALRTVWLFGKPYQWDRADGQLVLTPEVQPAPASEEFTYETITRLLSGPLPGPAG